MKRIYYAVLVAIICVSCDPPEIALSGGHESEWFIKNTTDMLFSISWMYDDIYEKVQIAPGDSIALGVVCSIRSIGDPKFSYITEIVGSYDDQGLIFYSEDGTQIRHWRWSERNDSGRQLFDESLWRKYVQDQQPQPDREGYIDVTWVFDVLPGDIKFPEE